MLNIGLKRGKFIKYINENFGNRVAGKDIDRWLKILDE